MLQRDKNSLVFRDGKREEQFFFLSFLWCSQLGGPEGGGGLDWVCFIL